MIDLIDPIDELHAAALRDDEAAVATSVTALGRASALRVIPRLLPGLREASPLIVEATGRAAEASLRAAGKRSFWAIDRELRTRGAIVLSPERVTWIAAYLGRGCLGALALASMQRDGFARARAIEALGGGVMDGLVVALLVVRLNDPVPEIASLAEANLAKVIEPAQVGPLVEALALIDSARATVRAGSRGVLERIAELLDGAGVRVRVALVEATRSRDVDLRVAAIARLASRFPEHAAARDALVLGLRDHDPRVRRAAAELVARGGLPSALVDPLLPMLEADRSTSIRLLGLRVRRRLGDEAALLQGCFDRNAGLRHYARRYHRGVGGHADYRALALARLESMDAGVLIGALATLADLGLAADRSQVEPLLGHPVRAVADEARRTLALLDAGVAPTSP